MTVEHWKPIPGFPDYAASDQGRIRREVPDYRGRVGHILKQSMPGRYAFVTLYIDGEPVNVSVHRVICHTFHGDPPSASHHAAHDNGDRKNNRANNLAWKTPAENEADKIRHGTSRKGLSSAVPLERRARGATHGRNTKPEGTARGERAGRAKLTEAKIVAIRKDPRARKVIASQYGITVTMVGYIKRGLAWAHVPQETGITA